MFYRLLQQGGKVIINVPNENWEWGYRPVEKQKGTVAEVVGFGEIVLPRIRSYGMKPGVHVNKAWTLIKVDGRGPFYVSSCFFEMTDKAEYERRIECWRSKRKDSLDDSDFLRDLPETKFWEGDTVLVYERQGRLKSVSVPTVTDKYLEALIQGKDPSKQTFLMVVGIEYDWPPLRYRVSDNFSAGWSQYSPENELELIERGNVWKYFHQQKPTFNDLKEEASFFKMLGHTEDVKNPANNLYSWTKDEVLEAIKAAIVDGFSVDVTPFTFGNKHISAIKFKDPDLGRRVRQTTLEGFDIK